MTDRFRDGGVPAMFDNQHGAATLLVADESQAIQRVIELTFAGEDIRIVAVGDGDAAIAHIGDQPPDIVLVDAGMPGKNGYEVATYIKQEPHLSHIPVLLLTGAFEPINQRRADEAGCDGVISKPFEPQLVIDRVKELLTRSRGGFAGPARAGTTPLSEIRLERNGLAAVVDVDREAAASESVADYFTKLDEAFANFPTEYPIIWPVNGSPSTVPASAPETRVMPPPPDSVEVLAEVSAEKQAPGTAPSTGVAASMPADAVPADAMPADAVPADAVSADAVPADAVSADAVSADAVSADPMSADAMDDLVERVAQRVLERLSDRVVRETAAEVVSSTAERLVREEIGRLKAAIAKL
jgi:pentapeptide MXKDX repeat protein